MAELKNIIEVTNLTKTFGDVHAVDNISFAVAEGERFAFLGPNGAGKSTTIKMLTTLLSPTSGTIVLAGHNPVEDADAARKSFGIVFQDPSLDEDLTAWENMEYDRKDSFVRDFSGGMKRRLEIARGLLHHPKIIFLDEPTLGLDPQTRNHMWQYLEKLNKEEGITVFFTTHYMDEADRVAERIAIIDHGKIIATGSGEELKKQTGTATLEEAFLKLTGSEIREEGADSLARMRMRHGGR
jgi:ABC-2 type transport system ATP-binding protein